MQAQPINECEYWKERIQERQIWALEWATEILEGQPFIEGPHHKIMCQTLDRVISGKIKRLIINVPPGYSKTLTAVWSFIARGFVVNPRARFIHTSYSADLALDNSAKVKELLLSDPFQDINPLQLRDDTKAKGLWRTDAGGGMRSAQTGGGITGFRAGQMNEVGFSGAMVVDDPMKPDTENSRVLTASQNKRYNNTIASRLAHEDVPIVVIMQRIVAFPGEFNTQEDLARCGDMSEFLLRGGSGEEWDHLVLPVEIDNTDQYPREWTHGRPIEHGLPDGPLWEYKHTKVDIERLDRANRYVYASQYKQRPKKRVGDPILERDWFGFFDECPTLKKICIYGDTASKTGESNDYSVLMAAGLSHEGNVYILDLMRDKWTIPELHRRTQDFWQFWKKHGATKIQIEDANSGTYLIQAMGETIGKSIVGITRHRDKFTRVNGVTERISSGKVFLPANTAWVEPFLDEMEAFTDNDTHEYDDQVDVVVDLIEDLLPIKGQSSVSFGIPGVT